MKELKKYYCFKFWLYEDRGIYSVDIAEYEDDEKPIHNEKIIFKKSIFEELISMVRKYIKSILED